MSGRHNKNGFFTDRGISLIEIVVSLVIVAVLTTVFIITLSGLKAGDNIDRATQSVQDDVVFVRSRAVSTNRNHRIRFTSTTAWVIEANVVGTSNWEQVGDVRQMPLDTYLDDNTWQNSLNNGTWEIEATPRGLFQMEGGTQAISEPYVTVTALGASRTKSLTVAVGGAISIDTN
jgi:Tfp pilus assembly protein FimT